MSTTLHGIGSHALEMTDADTQEVLHICVIDFIGSPEVRKSTLKMETRRWFKKVSRR